MHTIAIFASGAGSNAQQLINHFTSHSLVTVGLIVSNKPTAGVLDIAAKAGLPAMLLDKEKFFRGNAYADELAVQGINFIVLAGFLWKVPLALIRAYPGRIVNIHPALLPRYGGKGMYGSHVHEAVLQSHDTGSGITIHIVDELYDHGKIILQQRCGIGDNETADTLAQKIHRLEHLHYPVVVEALVKRTFQQQ